MKPTEKQLKLLSYGALFEAYQSALGNEDARAHRVREAAAQAKKTPVHPWYQQPLSAVADELRELRQRRTLTNILLDELLVRASLGRSA